MQMDTNWIDPFWCAQVKCPPWVVTSSVMFLAWMLRQIRASSPQMPHLYLRAGSELSVTFSCPSPALGGHQALHLPFGQSKKACVSALCVSVIPAFLDPVKPWTFTWTYKFSLKGKNKSKLLAVLADELKSDKWLRLLRKLSYFAFDGAVRCFVKNDLEFQRCLWNWWSTIVK